MGWKMDLTPGLQRAANMLGGGGWDAVTRQQNGGQWGQGRWTFHSPACLPAGSAAPGIAAHSQLCPTWGSSAQLDEY